MKLKKVNKALSILAEAIEIPETEILKCIVRATEGRILYHTAGNPQTVVTHVNRCKLIQGMDKVYIEANCEGEKGPIDYGTFVPGREQPRWDTSEVEK